MPSSRLTSPAPVELVDGVVCDLDGVVYHGPEAIPGAVEALRDLAGTCPVLFATNNASRTPRVVAEHLRRLGVPASADQVLTSSTTGARVLAGDLRAGTEVLAVGGDGVHEALREAGLVPLEPSAAAQPWPGAVLQGYGPDVTASDLAVASFVVASGARWVATNTDSTLPTDRGTAPGNGTLVAAVETATERTPEVVGKPGPLMYQHAAETAGLRAARMVGVGDRLETDISGAKAAGMQAAFVLTGVHGPGDLAVAGSGRRPDFVLRDLTDLHLPYEAAVLEGSSVRCGVSSAKWVEGGVESAGAGIEKLRAVLAVLWWAQDEGLLDAGAAADIARSSVGT